MERRGWGIHATIDLANRQQEEPTGYGGRRQPSKDATSRVIGDNHARFCESAGVKVPRATRPVSRTRSRERDAVSEMKEGPSGSVIRSRSQATASCCGQKPWW